MQPIEYFIISIHLYTLESLLLLDAGLPLHTVEPQFGWNNFDII